MVIISLVFFFTTSGNAQRFVTKTGFIRFYSDAPMEKIEAVNRQVNAGLEVSTGDFSFKVLLKSFSFEKALMQQHFNESYVESDKYPDATFLGKITNIKDVNLNKDKVYNVTLTGRLTIHGETKIINEKGTLEVKEGKILAKGKFNILLSDYKITVPASVISKISNTIEITVDVVLDKINP